MHPFRRSACCLAGRVGVSQAAILVCLAFFLFIGHALEAWTWHPERASAPLPLRQASETLIVLDPDQWSRQEVLELRRQGWLPLARLNIAFKESGRTFAHLIDQKWLVVPKHRPAPDPAPVRFYLESWQRLLLTRVDQIAHCGFSGIAIEGMSAAQAISDHPQIEREMNNWISTVSLHFKRLGIGEGRVFLRSETQAPPVFADTRANIDGIIASNVLTTPSGRFRHPWEQAAPLKILSAWSSQQKRVLLLESPRTASHRNRILEETRTLGFEADFVIPKGDHR